MCLCTDLFLVPVEVESATNQDTTPLPHHNHSGEDLGGGVIAGHGLPATVTVPPPREASLGTRIKKPR